MVACGGLAACHTVLLRNPEYRNRFYDHSCVPVCCAESMARRYDNTVVGEDLVSVHAVAAENIVIADGAVFQLQQQQQPSVAVANPAGMENENESAEILQDNADGAAAVEDGAGERMRGGPFERPLGFIRSSLGGLRRGAHEPPQQQRQEAPRIDVQPRDTSLHIVHFEASLLEENSGRELIQEERPGRVFFDIRTASITFGGVEVGFLQIWNMLREGTITIVDGVTIDVLDAQNIIVCQIDSTTSVEELRSIDASASQKIVINNIQPDQISRPEVAACSFSSDPAAPVEQQTMEARNPQSSAAASGCSCDPRGWWRDTCALGLLAMSIHQGRQGSRRPQRLVDPPPRTSSITAVPEVFWSSNNGVPCVSSELVVAEPASDAATAAEDEPGTSATNTNTGADAASDEDLPRATPSRSLPPPLERINSRRQSRGRGSTAAGGGGPRSQALATYPPHTYDREFPIRAIDAAAEQELDRSRHGSDDEAADAVEVDRPDGSGSSPPRVAPNALALAARRAIPTGPGRFDRSRSRPFNLRRGSHL